MGWIPSKAWHLKVILRHATTHSIQYQRYQLTRVQIQVFQIILRRFHLNHQTKSIINKDNIKRNKKYCWSKKCFNHPIKKCANITAVYASKVIKLKLYEDPLQRRDCFLYLINSFKVILSQFKGTYMLLMEYPYIRWEHFPDYAKNSTWNLLHAYIDAHNQILIY